METIEEWVEGLKNSNKLIIVEGKKDKKALENFGIKNIKFLSGSIYKFIESIREKEVILLFDLDPEGKRLYSIFNKELSKRGIKIDHKFREFLFRTKLTNIEGLIHYINYE